MLSKKEQTTKRRSWRIFELIVFLIFCIKSLGIQLPCQKQILVHIVSGCSPLLWVVPKGFGGPQQSTINPKVFFGVFWNRTVLLQWTVLHCFTPWKINMEPKNGGLEGDVPFQQVIFRFHVSFRGCTIDGPRQDR